MRSGPFVTCLVAAAGAAAGAALMMEAPRPAAAELIPAADLTVINPVATQDVGTLVRLASEMTVRGDFAQAADALSRALDVGPQTPHLLVDRGLLRLRLGDVTAARDDFNSALALDEHAAGAVAGVGLTWLAAGEHDKAVQCFDLAISRDPTLSYAWRGRGEALAAADDHAGAVAALDEAVRLNGRDAGALVLRARSRALIKDGRGALEDARLAIELAPFDMDAWYTLGSLHLLRREFDDTIRSADRALTIDPAAEDMLALRAWAKSARGQIKSGAEDAHAALQLAPENWRHRTAMMTLARAGAPEDEPLPVESPLVIQAGSSSAAPEGLPAVTPAQTPEPAPASAAVPMPDQPD